MATITIDTGTAAQTTRILDAFATAYGYQANIPNNGGTIPNPETKAQFAKRKLAEYVREVVRGVESGTAAESARATANASVDSLTIT